MIKYIFKYTILIFIAIIYFALSIKLLANFNSSIYKAFIIIYLLLLFIIFFGTIISKIIFNFRINKKITLTNFEKAEISTNIKLSTIILFILFSISYVIIYLCGDKLFYIFTNTSGIINSCTYLSKIFLITLPLYAFELTYLNYCSFFKSFIHPITVVSIKSIFIYITSIVLTFIFGINGFLYSKISIDILIVPYYIIKLRKIINLTKERI